MPCPDCDGLPERVTELQEQLEALAQENVALQESFIRLGRKAEKVQEQYEELNALHANGMFLGRPIEHWEGLQEQLEASHNACGIESMRCERAEGDRDRLREQLEALDQWSRDVLPQLSRLIDIIEGRHEDARLIAPHGQTSASPHALLDRWRSLHSNPASSPNQDSVFE